MLIRTANSNDIRQLQSLYLLLEKDGVKYQPEHFVMGYRDNNFFQEIFSSHNQEILVAETQGKIMGFSHVMILKQKNVACLKPQTLVYIQDLVVLDYERGKGIGTLLINASKEYGKRNGADFIRTQVFPQNIDGLKFYEKNGFCEMMKTIEYQF